MKPAARGWAAGSRRARARHPRPTAGRGRPRPEVAVRVGTVSPRLTLPLRGSRRPSSSPPPPSLREQELDLEAERPVGAELGRLDVVERLDRRVDRQLAGPEQPAEAAADGHRPDVLALLRLPVG